jgi:hypothetical protein
LYPEAHSVTASYLLFTDGSFNDSHATKGGGFLIRTATRKPLIEAAPTSNPF